MAQDVLAALGLAYALWMSRQGDNTRPQIFLRDTMTGEKVVGIELWPVFAIFFAMAGILL